MSIICKIIEEKTYERLAFNAIFWDTRKFFVFNSAKWLLLIAGATLVAWWMGVMLQCIVLLILYGIVISISARLIIAYNMSCRLTDSKIYDSVQIFSDKQGLHAFNGRNYTFSVYWKNVNRYFRKKTGFFLCNDGNILMFIPRLMLTPKGDHILQQAIEQYVDISQQPENHEERNTHHSYALLRVDSPNRKDLCRKERQFKIKYLLPFLVVWVIIHPFILSLLGIGIFGVYFILCWLHFSFVVEVMFGRLNQVEENIQFICERDNDGNLKIERENYGVWSFSCDSIVEKIRQESYVILKLNNGILLPYTLDKISCHENESTAPKNNRFPKQHKALKWLFHILLFILTWIITIIHTLPADCNPLMEIPILKWLMVCNGSFFNSSANSCKKYYYR